MAFQPLDHTARIKVNFFPAICIFTLKTLGFTQATGMFCHIAHPAIFLGALACHDLSLRAVDKIILFISYKGICTYGISSLFSVYHHSEEPWILSIVRDINNLSQEN